jgi:hypothetical protein
MPYQNRHYYKTLDIPEPELQQLLNSCRNQDNKVYKLFQKFGTMTKWDCYDLYCYFHIPILPSSIGRSISTLTNQGIIRKTGIMVQSDDGFSNGLYELVQGDLEEVQAYYTQRTPTSISVRVITKYNSEGLKELDYEAMVEELGNKMERLENNLNNN